MPFRSRLYTTTALGAVVSGLLRVLRAPVLIIGIYVATLAVVAPFAIVLGARLQAALASQQVLHDEAHALDADIDAEWWLEFARHARGLEATFTPAIIGAAAPLESLSALLDGDRPAAVLLMPIAMYMVLWALLWGGVIERLHHGRALGLSSFFAAGARHFARFVVLALIAASAYVLLYATVHAVLFGPVFSALRDSADSERAAFVWRAALYVVFGLCLVAVSLVVDYTRVVSVTGRLPLGPSVQTAARFLRARARTVIAAHLLVGFLFALLLAGYVVVDVFGGVRVGGWRAVVIAQAFVVGRLVIRLLFAATAVTLATEGAGTTGRSTS